MKLSVQIVSWNCREHVLRCLAAIAEWEGMEHEILLIDNHSNDDTVASVCQLFPNVKIIESPLNVGFGAGHNLGFAAASGDYVLILNPDTQVSGQEVLAATRALEADPTTALIGGQLTNINGKPQKSYGAFPSLANMLVQRLVVPHPPQNVSEVDWLAGAFLLARLKDIREVGGFDEDFFLFGEEIDLCKRLKARGHRMMWDPNLKVKHLGQGSTGGSSRVEAARTVGMILYYQKHNGAISTTGYRMIRLVAALFSLMLGYLTRSAKVVEANKLQLSAILYPTYRILEPITGPARF